MLPTLYYMHPLLPRMIKWRNAHIAARFKDLEMLLGLRMRVGRMDDIGSRDNYFHQ